MILLKKFKTRAGDYLELYINNIAVACPSLFDVKNIFDLKKSHEWNKVEEIYFPLKEALGFKEIPNLEEWNFQYFKKIEIESIEFKKGKLYISADKNIFVLESLMSYADCELKGEDFWWEKWGEFIINWVSEKANEVNSSDWGGFGFGGSDLFGNEN